MTDNDILGNFPPATAADWMARVAANLKGESFERRLVSYSAEGIRIDPLYGERVGPRAGRPHHGPWGLLQRVDHPDPARANLQALDDLENGATGLVLTVAGAAGARGFGLCDGAEATLNRALAGVALHAVAIRLEAGPQGRIAAGALGQVIRGRALNPALLDIGFGMDPLSVDLNRGGSGGDWAARAALVRQTVETLADEFRGPFMVADGRSWHEAGATGAQELGIVLAAGVSYLRALDTLNAAALSRAVSVTLTAAADLFQTLAKFRAMRLLWARVLEAAGLPDTPLHLHAETSWRMMAELDPHTNILRTCTAVMGAGLGGASSITALPFSVRQGLPNGFARRVARHQQAVLIEEAELWRVADPALGAGYAGHLTDELCIQAWALFQEIERRGGLVKTIDQGWLMAAIAAQPREGGPVIGTETHRLKREFEAAVEIWP